MEDKSITARICAFARAYHSAVNEVKIFDDTVARKVISNVEAEIIAKSMIAGIEYFNAEFSGNDDEILRWIVDNQLSQTPLGRSAFTEKSLKSAVNFGAKQYMIFAAGYDTFAYRQPTYAKKLEIFEIDYPETSDDKQKRCEKIGIPNNLHYIKADFSISNWENSIAENSAFDKNKVCFCSILGITYYLTKYNFEKCIKAISNLIPLNSTIVFDYPDENYFSNNNKNSELAEASNEKMQSCYSYCELEKILEKSGFLIFEHLTPEDITRQYFSDYNIANPKHKMSAQKNVNYCLAVKK